jgi:hypothetical protein
MWKGPNNPHLASFFFSLPSKDHFFFLLLQLTMFIATIKLPQGLEFLLINNLQRLKLHSW